MRRGSGWAQGGGGSQNWRQHSWNPQVSRSSGSNPLSLFFKLSLVPVGQAGAGRGRRPPSP